MNDGRPDFPAFLDKVGSILTERNAGYGTKNITGPAQVLARIKDKVARLEQAIRDGRESPNDWEDLAGHASIGWLLERGLWDDRKALRRVYFAHPAGKEVTEKVQMDCDFMAREIGKVFAVYRPVGPFVNVAGHADWVWPVCLRAIELADMLVAFLPYRSPGVAAEMLYAKMQGKTVWAVVHKGVEESSLVQYAADRIFVDAHGFFKTLQEVGRNVDDGKRSRDEIPPSQGAQAATEEDGLRSG